MREKSGRGQWQSAVGGNGRREAGDGRREAEKAGGIYHGGTESTEVDKIRGFPQRRKGAKVRV